MLKEPDIVNVPGPLILIHGLFVKSASVYKLEDLPLDIVNGLPQNEGK